MRMFSFAALSIFYFAIFCLPNGVEANNADGSTAGYSAQDQDKMRHYFYWTTPFSEEGENSREAAPGYYLAGYRCSGSFCDSRELMFASMDSIPFIRPTDSKSFTTTDGSPRLDLTGASQLITGVSCAGRFCDNVTLKYANDTGINLDLGRAMWTGFISEENPNSYIAPPGWFIIGYECQRDFCDNRRFKVAPLANLPERTVPSVPGTGGLPWELTRPPVAERGQGDVLTAGKSLKAGEYLESPSGRYRAVMEPNGNFSLWDWEKPELTWRSGATCSGATIVLQSDGNLVIYADGKSYWASGTDTRFADAPTLRLQDDGNMVLQARSGQTAWQSRTHLNILGSEFKPGKRLMPTDTIVSPSKQYRATMQADGDLIIFRTWPAPGAIVWWAGTRNYHPGDKLYFDFKADGNLVHERELSDKGSYGPYFETGTAGKGVTALTLNNDGVLQLKTGNGSVVWNSPARERSFGTRLEAGTVWERNSYLASPSGKYRAYMDADGSFGIYEWPERRITHAGCGCYGCNEKQSAAQCSGFAKAVLLANGNFVFYFGLPETFWYKTFIQCAETKGTPFKCPVFWESNTTSPGGAYLSLSDTGVLSVNAKSTNTALWSSDKGGFSQTPSCPTAGK